MTSKRGQILVLIACVAISVMPLRANAQENSIPATEVCTSSAQFFVGACYIIHARLEQGADNIRLWIWPVGTKRYLGWAEKALRCSLPTQIEELTGSGKTVYANIAVRPVSKSRPGHMQYVCVASAKKSLLKIIQARRGTT
jgi:hypothetical protein